MFSRWSSSGVTTLCEAVACCTRGAVTDISPMSRPWISKVSPRHCADICPLMMRRRISQTWLMQEMGEISHVWLILGCECVISLSSITCSGSAGFFSDGAFIYAERSDTPNESDAMLNIDVCFVLAKPCYRKINSSGINMPIASSIPPMPQSPCLPLSMKIPVRVIRISAPAKMSENHVHALPGL